MPDFKPQAARLPVGDNASDQKEELLLVYSSRGESGQHALMDFVQLKPELESIRVFACRRGPLTLADWEGKNAATRQPWYEFDVWAEPLPLWLRNFGRLKLNWHFFLNAVDPTRDLTGRENWAAGLLDRKKFVRMIQALEAEMNFPCVREIQDAARPNVLFSEFFDAAEQFRILRRYVKAKGRESALGSVVDWVVAAVNENLVNSGCSLGLSTSEPAIRMSEPAIRMVEQCPSLLGRLWIEFYEALLGKVEHGICRHCGGPFRSTGRERGKRRQYCQPNCKTAFSRANRKRSSSL